jgi:hypothetical protein
MQWSGGSVSAETSCPQAVARAAGSPQGGVVQHGDAVGGADLEAPVGVQDELEVVGVQRGVLATAQEASMRRRCDRMATA